MLHINKFLILYKFIMLKKIFNSEIKEIINCLTKIKRSKNKSFKNLCVDAKTSLDNGGKIMFCGNGGSASDAQHLAAELVVKYQKKRKALAAISLSTDTSVLTATGNDFGFDQIFSRQVEALGKTGDLLICITTSGKSKNIIKAIKSANKKKIKCFALSGNKGGLIKNLDCELIDIPHKKTSIIQVCQITLGQILCDYLENNH